MNLKHLFVAVPALLILGNGVANAAETINDTGALACINDKWDEKEVDKGHKLVDYAGRCINIPADRLHRSTLKTAWASTSTCPTRVGRAAEPAPTNLKKLKI